MEKYSVITDEDLLVDLTFHGFSASLLEEFALKIVKPYFKGNMNKTIKNNVVSSRLGVCVVDFKKV
jgi:hypothetical protein